jgi:hypothetical protein
MSEIIYVQIGDKKRKATIEEIAQFEAEQEKESKDPLSGRRTAPASPLNKSKLGYDELDTYMMGGCFDDNK